MEAHICEEDLLSGIELLPVTEPNTPENILDESSTSSLSILSDMNSPTKSFHLISPAKLQQSPSEKTPSESASQLQKLLHDSLASSLRKEAELKSKWPASPGEIRLASSIKNHSKTETAVTSKPGNVGPISGAAVYTSLLNKNNLLTVPSNSLHSEDKQALNENNRKSSHFTTPKKSTKGPNICLANQFPSGLSPIKHCPERNSKKHLTVRTSVEDIQLASDDPNTKKLLAFINQLEKGSDNDKSVADQLAQLSILLKNSSAEVGHNEEIGQGDHDGDSFVKQQRKNQTEEVLSKEKVDHSAYQDKISDNMSTEQSLKHIDATQSKTQSSKSNAVSGNYFKTSSNKEAKSAQNYKIANSVKSRSGRTNQVSKATKDSMAVERTRNEKKEKVKREMDVRKASKSKMTKNAPIQVLKEGAKEQDIRSTTDKIGIESKPLQDMTAVRNHLHGMLNFHKIDPTSLDFSAIDIQNSTHDSKAEDTFHSNDTAILLRAQPKDVLPLSPSKDSSQNLTESLSSGLFGLLKAGQKQPSSGRSSIDSSLAAENEILRDTLEKETYRRKHCEKQIQKLQKKILDIQQELAVANSTDRKKDLMIEQLDKTLAKVVDGWKGHEANLAKSIEQLSLEKESNIEEIVKLKEMVVGLENELAKALEELVEEKERVLHFEEKEKAMQMNYQARTQEISQVIDQKNESLQRLQTKIDKLSEDRTLLKQSMDNIQLEMQDQKKAFITKEEEWEEAIIELEKRHKDELEKEKIT
ncbi:unnamed protein product [Clavelina lepadiformis]|uniref:Centrobin n=1 Tax=Clavelina lepadiformis TaxID=159417 RepID=A0ABP0H5K1_CLALP